jgi:hypothetical protein
VRFAKVAMRAGAASGLEVRLGDGTVARGERVEEVVSVVKVLRGRRTMLAFPHSVRVFVAVAPADMRKSFNGQRPAAREQPGE